MDWIQNSESVMTYDVFLFTFWQHSIFPLRYTIHVIFFTIKGKFTCIFARITWLFGKEISLLMLSNTGVQGLVLSALIFITGQDNYDSRILRNVLNNRNVLRVNDIRLIKDNWESFQ